MLDGFRPFAGVLATLADNLARVISGILGDVAHLVLGLAEHSLGLASHLARHALRLGRAISRQTPISLLQLAADFLGRALDPIHVHLMSCWLSGDGGLRRPSARQRCG